MATSPAITQWDAQGTPIQGAPSQWDAQGNPIHAPQPMQSAQPAGLTDNPKGEGTYAMKNPQGQTVPVPYSNVHHALDQGHLFADKGTLQKYARDHAADPLDESRVDQWLDKHPYLGLPVNLLAGAGTGALKTFTGLDTMPNEPGKNKFEQADRRAETETLLAANTPTKGLGQGLGEGGENVGEFFSGEELLSLLGKAGAAMGMTQKLKTMTGLSQMLEKAPPIVPKLLKIGMSAVKQGTVGGAQTYAKTGDVGAAATAAGETGLLSAGLNVTGATGAALKAARAGAPEVAAPMVEKVVGGVKIPVAEEAAKAAATPTAQASSEAYGALSRQTIEPHLTALNSAPQLVKDTLATTHDLTGASDRLQQKVLNPLYDTLNEATGGKFRTLNEEVQAAKRAARPGGAAELEAYKNKLGEMENLLDTETGGAVPKDYLGKIKNAWTTSYTLDDLGDMWDKNLNGAPGASQVSQTQRGINGNGLMADIQRAIKVHGRTRIEAALGPGGLENFEDIARYNQTNAKRKAFNMGVQTVAAALPEAKPIPDAAKGHAVAAVAGLATHLAGGPWYLGALGGEAGYYATQKVLNVLKTNPQVGRNFMFALESGATPAKYGPFIATMIQQHETQAARERLQSEQPAPEGQEAATTP